jgi:dTDP-4-dehydrorhamnose reductase
LARGTAAIIGRSICGEPGHWSFGGREGIYHLACGGATTWFGFARRIFELADVQTPPVLTPISTDEYGARAKRPAYSVLDCSKTRETFGVALTDWNVALEELFRTEHAALRHPTMIGSGERR